MGIVVLCLIVAGFSLVVIYFANITTNRCAENIKQATAPGLAMISAQLSSINFTTTREIAVNYFCEVRHTPVEIVKIDSQSKRVAICNYETSRYICFNFNDILGCELVEDHNIIFESGIERAVVGGVVAGGVGAIVASNTAKSKDVVHSLTIRLITSNVDNPQVVLEVLSNSWRKDDEMYRSILNHAREIYSIFNSIILSNSKSSNLHY